MHDELRAGEARRVDDLAVERGLGLGEELLRHEEAHGDVAGVAGLEAEVAVVGPDGAALPVALVYEWLDFAMIRRRRESLQRHYFTIACVARLTPSRTTRLQCGNAHVAAAVRTPAGPFGRDCCVRPRARIASRAGRFLCRTSVKQYPYWWDSLPGLRPGTENSELRSQVEIAPSELPRAGRCGRSSARAIPGFPPRASLPSAARRSSSSSASASDGAPARGTAARCSPG